MPIVGADAGTNGSGLAHAVPRSLNEGERGDAAEIIGGLIGLTDRAEVRLSVGELFRCWQSYTLVEHGNLLDDDGSVYAHISEFEEEDEG